MKIDAFLNNNDKEKVFIAHVIFKCGESVKFLVKELSLTVNKDTGEITAYQVENISSETYEAIHSSIPLDVSSTCLSLGTPENLVAAFITPLEY